MGVTMAAARREQRGTDVTRDEFSRCIALIRRYWPHAGASWDADTIETWESLLLDLDTNPVAAAVQALAADGRDWPPPPGLVRRRACELIWPLPDADEAWGQVREQIRRVGSSRGVVHWPSGETVEPVWSHPLVGEVADRFGWSALCQSTNEMADRAHFLRMWEQASASHRATTSLPPAARAALAAHGIELPDLRAKELRP